MPGSFFCKDASQTARRSGAISSASSKYGLSVRQRSGSIGRMRSDLSKGNNTPAGRGMSLSTSERTGSRRHEPALNLGVCFSDLCTQTRSQQCEGDSMAHDPDRDVHPQRIALPGIGVEVVLVVAFPLPAV